MRLENKLHKWFKFILKSIPFWFIIFSVLNIFFNENTVFDINDIIKNNFSSNNLFFDFMREFIPNYDAIIPFTNIIDELIRLIFGLRYLSVDNFYLYNVIFYVFATFLWFILIDFIDLIFSAFRFIIDIAHSWLDGFYTRSKRGGK